MTTTHNRKCVTQDRANVTGDRLIISGDYSKVHGNYNTISGDHCNIVGDYNVVSGDHCVIVGDLAIVSGDYCYITGNHANVSGDYCKITGENATISGDRCVLNGAKQPVNSRRRDREVVNFGNHTEINNAVMFAGATLNVGGGGITVTDGVMYVSGNVVRTTGRTTVIRNGVVEQFPTGLNFPGSVGTKFPEPWTDEPTTAPEGRATCCVCMEREAVVNTRPCNHVSTCVACTLALKSGMAEGAKHKCPKCRNPVDAFDRLFMD